MSDSFVHIPHPARVVFGAGRRREVGDEVERLGRRRVLLVAEPARADEVARSLGGRVAETITDIVMHVPRDRADAACALSRTADVDSIVAVGGGSAIGLAKAVALASGLPIVAIPTTYAGSEMTSVWGVTEADGKHTGRSDAVRPKTVLYDPELTRTLPAGLAGKSAMNAIAHAMEALYAPGVSPLLAAIAEESIRALAEHVPARHAARPASADPEAVARGAAIPGHADPEAGALYGAWLAGMCLDQSTMGLHHKLCHVLGGTFGLPHADVHSVVVAHVAAFNAPAAPRAMARLARALGALSARGVAGTLGAADPSTAADALGGLSGPAALPGEAVTAAPAALFALAQRLGASRSLAEIGFAAADVARAADVATTAPYANPRAVERDAIVTLLGDALAGRAPRVWSSSSKPEAP